MKRADANVSEQRWLSKLLQPSTTTEVAVDDRCPHTLKTVTRSECSQCSIDPAFVTRVAFAVAGDFAVTLDDRMSRLAKRGGEARAAKLRRQRTRVAAPEVEVSPFEAIDE